MNTFFKSAIAFALAVALTLGLAANASAQSNTRHYAVAAYASTDISVQVCSWDSNIRVDGDHTTDLDFIVFDEGGDEVFRDFDDTDILWVKMPGNQGDGCRHYTVRILNRGSVYNDFNFRMIWA